MSNLLINLSFKKSFTLNPHSIIRIINTLKNVERRCNDILLFQELVTSKYLLLHKIHSPTPEEFSEQFEGNTALQFNVMEQQMMHCRGCICLISFIIENCYWNGPSTKQRRFIDCRMLQTPPTNGMDAKLCVYSFLNLWERIISFCFNSKNDSSFDGEVEDTSNVESFEKEKTFVVSRHSRHLSENTKMHAIRGKIQVHERTTPKDKRQ